MNDSGRSIVKAVAPAGVGHREWTIKAELVLRPAHLMKKEGTK
jgi:hypothetical protein